MKAYNWQLKREINYPNEVKRPKRQFSVVMDLNKCIASQTCTVACKTTWPPGRGQEYMLWNNVETKPYGCYPLGWDVRLLELLEEVLPPHSLLVCFSIPQRVNPEGLHPPTRSPHPLYPAFPNPLDLYLCKLLK